MSDLISREDVLDQYVKICVLCGKKKRNPIMCKACYLDDAICIVEDAPSAEPERKKGKWVKVGHFGRSYKCDQCGNFLDFDGVNVGRGDANFCPNCGADMRGEK